MTKNTWRSVRGWIPAALTSVALAGASWGPTYTLAGDVIVRTYQTPEGNRLGSASLPLNLKTGVRSQVQHVILLDTSASQIGEHRQMATAVLMDFLKTLPVEDRVSVLAYDVRTAPLTSGFVSAETARNEVAANLKSRFPAGSANLNSGLLAAQDQLKGAGNGSVLIIGDGMSTAHLFRPEELKSLTASFREQQIPIHSFALGSKTDVRLLGILGEETGGYVMKDEWSKSAFSSEKVASILSNATHQQVFYPRQISVSGEGIELSPNRALPMRTDRETVYLLSGPIEAGTQISIQGELNGKAEDLKYSLPEAIRTNGNTFLSTFWADAKATDGVAIGFAGEWMVNFAHQSFEDQITLISAEGQKAIAGGDLQQAEQIGTLLQQVDPYSPRGDALVTKARTGHSLIAQLPAAPGAADANPDQNPPAAPAPGAPILPDSLLEREFPVPSGNIANYEALVQAKGQKLQREVEVQINRAYDLVENSLGSQAEEVLNRTRATIKSATDVNPELANNLLRRVNTILQDVRSRRAMFDARQQELQRRQAELEVSARLIEYSAERDLKLEQMVDRIRALMKDAAQGNPDAFEQAEAQARTVLSDYPGSAIGNAAVVWTEAAGQVDKAARLRSLRADRLLETLYQVELSHVPFPDEPPIVYPPAEVWWALTETRKKWKSVDLKINSKNEEKIYDALDRVTAVEFPGTPLKGAIEYLAQMHDIPIILDIPALEDESLTGEEEVNLVLAGIKLKSALKLMLENVGGVELTYVIEDEVMKITTRTSADEKMQTRVYPVADLVIPVMPLGGGMMGGMGGGMMGGMGGGMGGMGGGMGGMGGGMGGMGGMGGGMFSIPATPELNAPAVVVPAEVVKKKPAP